MATITRNLYRWILGSHCTGHDVCLSMAGSVGTFKSFALHPPLYWDCDCVLRPFRMVSEEGEDVNHKEDWYEWTGPHGVKFAGSAQEWWLHKQDYAWADYLKGKSDERTHAAYQRKEGRLNAARLADREGSLDAFYKKEAKQHARQVKELSNLNAKRLADDEARHNQADIPQPRFNGVRWKLEGQDPKEPNFGAHWPWMPDKAMQEARDRIFGNEFGSNPQVREGKLPKAGTDVGPIKPPEFGGKVGEDWAARRGLGLGPAPDIWTEPRVTIGESKDLGSAYEGDLLAPGGFQDYVSRAVQGDEFGITYFGRDVEGARALSKRPARATELTNGRALSARTGPASTYVDLRNPASWDKQYEAQTGVKPMNMSEADRWKAWLERNPLSVYLGWLTQFLDSGQADKLTSGIFGWLDDVAGQYLKNAGDALTGGNAAALAAALQAEWARLNALPLPDDGKGIDWEERRRREAAAKETTPTANGQDESGDQARLDQAWLHSSKYLSGEE